MDKVVIKLTDVALQECIAFLDIALERMEPVRIRLRETPRDLSQHEKACLMMRSALLARLHIRLSIASLKGREAYRVRLPMEEACALMAEWTSPIPADQRSLLCVAHVVGVINQALA